MYQWLPNPVNYTEQLQESPTGAALLARPMLVMLFAVCWTLPRHFDLVLAVPSPIIVQLVFSRQSKLQPPFLVGDRLAHDMQPDCTLWCVGQKNIISDELFLLLLRIDLSKWGPTGHGEVVYRSRSLPSIRDF